jgi:hypothetical protein
MNPAQQLDALLRESPATAQDRERSSFEGVSGGRREIVIGGDIEGVELLAVKGARDVIEKHRPVLAVCGYHTPDHLWRVPALMKTLAPDSRMFVRSHCVDGFDTVWYSIPPERMVRSLAAPMGSLTGRKVSRPETRGAAS